MKKKRDQPRLASPVRVPRASALRLRVLAGAALLIVGTSAAYYPSLQGGFIYDDTALLTHNPLMRAADGIYRFWFTAQAIDYWPVFNSTLWLEWRLWGLSPAGYHATNLAFHVVDALLIWGVLARLSIPGALLAALLFALHPVNVESVAWIAQLKGLLAMFFLLLTLRSYLQSETRSSQHPNASPPAVDYWYWLSLVGFVLAMLSKGSAAVFPVLLLAILWWLRPLSTRDVVRVMPFVLVTAVFIPVNVWFRARFDTPASSTGLLDRLLGAAAAIWFYLYKALLPLELSFLYPKWHIDAERLQWWLPLLAAIAVTGVLWRYRRNWGRPLLFAWIVFTVSLAPVLGVSGAGLMEQYSVADHYQYVGVISVVALMAAAWATWDERVRGPVRWVGTAGAVAAASAFAVLTWQQSELYRDAITLYQASLRNSPDSALAHNNLGLALSDALRLQQAIEQFEEALRLKPDYDEAHSNLGLTLVKAEKPEEALAHFELAVRLRPSDATYRYQLGAALAATHQLQPAIEELQETVRLRPDHAEAHNDLGSALVEAQRPQEAIEHFEQALRLAADLPEAHYNLGRARLLAGQPQEAIGHFRQALRFQPDRASLHSDLGVALFDTGRRQEAIGEFQAALRLDPNDREARANLDEVSSPQSTAPE